MVRQELVRLLVVGILLGIAADVHAVEPRAMRVVRRTGRAFGVTAEAIATAASEVEARLVEAQLKEALLEFSRVENLLDPRRPGSATHSLHLAAGAEPVSIDPEALAVLAELKRFAKGTDGAYDPTVGAVSVAYGQMTAQGAPAEIGSRQVAVPSDDELAAVLHFVDHRGLKLDLNRRAGSLVKPGVVLDVNGPARGYALDRAARRLESNGVTSFVLSLGGDVVVRGNKDGKPWTVGVQDPRGPGHFATLSAPPGALATVGDYQRAILVEGERLHEHFDPRTGSPASGARAVTVLAADALTATVAARAIMVLGPREGLRWLSRVPGAEALIVTVDNKVLMTRALREYTRHQQPTQGR